MRGDDRYAPVAAALPSILPPITREEADRAQRMLCRKFGGKAHGSVNMTHAVRRYPVRRCWISLKPTRGESKGWGRLIHDVSHRIFERRHPTFRAHDGGHATLEREIAQFVAASGWLDGGLRPKARVKLSTEERRLVRLERTEASITRWLAKQKRAENALRKLKTRRRVLLRTLTKGAIV